MDLVKPGQREVMTTPVVIKPKSRPLTEIIQGENHRKRRRRLLWWCALGLIPVLAIVAFYALRPRAVPMVARFRVQPLTQGDVVRVIHATGHVDAVTTVQVAPKSPDAS